MTILLAFQKQILLFYSSYGKMQEKNIISAEKLKKRPYMRRTRIKERGILQEREKSGLPVWAMPLS